MDTPQLHDLDEPAFREPVTIPVKDMFHSEKRPLINPMRSLKLSSSLHNTVLYKLRGSASPWPMDLWIVDDAKLAITEVLRRSSRMRRFLRRRCSSPRELIERVLTDLNIRYLRMDLVSNRIHRTDPVGSSIYLRLNRSSQPDYLETDVLGETLTRELADQILSANAESLTDARMLLAMLAPTLKTDADLRQDARLKAWEQRRMVEAERRRARAQEQKTFETGAQERVIRRMRALGLSVPEGWN